MPSSEDIHGTMLNDEHRGGHTSWRIYEDEIHERSGGTVKGAIGIE